MIDNASEIRGLKLNKLRKILMIEKKISMYKWLRKRKFYYVDIKSDGNCGPRAIAAGILGNQERHEEVR